jgi:hypothetical protein
MNKLYEDANKHRSSGSALKCFVIRLYAPIFEIVGRMTLPKNAVQCELDQWWVPCNYVDLPKDVWGREHDYHYRYNYQSLKQNRFGAWNTEPAWIGRHYDMDYYKQQKALGV